MDGLVSGLLDMVTVSSIDGDRRSCTLADGVELSETIISIDEDHQRMAYTITASPFGIQAHSASMQASDAGDGQSTFQWITDVKPDDLADALGLMLAGEVAKLEARFDT
ncbi:MAG: hypothetical protein ACI9C1_002879 [Candidatus Aldehydirespiratoraceae bacterium]|jgi:hypothetical protein